ncbi:MAG: ribonuclease HII [Acidobacteriota bacterium]
MPVDPLSAFFAELGRLSDLQRLERELARRGYRLVAGVDEVGRGCLAGPVVAAAVILPPDCVLPGLDDSKRLDAEARERLEPQVRRRAVAVGVGHVEAPEIDERNILRASLRAMRQAIEALAPAPEILLVDAVRVPGVRLPQLPVVHGDALCASIAAASIVAKVHRDRLLQDLARRYPVYGFEHHKGYGTAEHWQALRQYGPCPEHRLSFEGVATGSDRAGEVGPPSREARRRKEAR